MKHFLALFCLLMFAIHSGHSQESITLKMTMKMEGLPPEYAAFGEQEIISYSKGEMYKKEVISMMGSSTISFDGRILTQLHEGMDTKIGYTLSKEEMSQMMDQEKKDPPKIEYTSESKKIAGYECTKAILTFTTADQGEKKITAWVTDKIKMNQNLNKTKGQGSKIDLSDLKGQPLQIEATQNNNGNEVKIVFTTTEVSTAALDDSVFKLNTEGYTMMTYQEARDFMKKTPGSGNR